MGLYDRPLFHQEFIRIPAGDNEGFAGVEEAVKAGGFVFAAVNLGQTSGSKGRGRAALLAD